MEAVMRGVCTGCDREDAELHAYEGRWFCVQCYKIRTDTFNQIATLLFNPGEANNE